jgi:hypothetical protein
MVLLLMAIEHNASGLVYNAPERGYWEYSAGIGNILKFVLILL